METEPTTGRSKQTCYEVEDQERGERLALKAIDAASGVSLFRFKREFRAFADLDHPNLVRMIALLSDGPRWAITMEVVRGVSLLDAIRWRPAEGAPRSSVADSLELFGTDLAPPPFEAGRGPADPDETLDVRGRAPSLPVAAPTPETHDARVCCDLPTLLRLLPQLLDALEYLHLRGLVHLDIKPANVLVDAAGRLALLDFGIGRSLKDAAATHAPGAIVGTVAYMAPEQVSSQGLGPATDIYALGCVLFQALSGGLPFQGMIPQVLHAHVHASAPVLAGRVPELPAALAETVQQMLAKEPAERPDIADIRRALGLARLGPDPIPRANVPFVGRAALLAQLTGWLSAPGPVLLLTGPGGSGKSALVAELTRRARAGDITVMHGRCYEREALPFRAFDAIADQLAFLIRRWPASGRKDLEPELGAIRELFPIFAVFKAVARHDSNDPALRRLQAFAALRRLLERVCALSPLVLCIDDLQWADPESLVLLSTLCEPAPAGLHILATTRDPARPSAAELPHRRLLLGELDYEDVAALGEALLGEPLDAAAVDALCAQSHGNVLLTVALLRSWRQGDQDAPPELSAMLRAQREQLSPPARRLLDIASVAGGACPEAILRASGGLEPTEISDALDQLVRADLLRSAPGAAAAGRNLDLTHDRVREVVYASLSTTERQAMHRELALRFEASGAHPEVLLRHWRASDEPERAARYLEAATQAAIESLAFERGIALLEERLALANAPAARVDLLVGRADLREILGDIAGASQDLLDATGLLAPEDPRHLHLELRRAGNLLKQGQQRAGTQLADARMRSEGLRLLRPAWQSPLVIAWLALVVMAQFALPRGLVRSRSSDLRRKVELHRRLLETLFLVKPVLHAELALRTLVLLQRLDDPSAIFYRKATLALLLLGVEAQGGTLATAARLFEAAARRMPNAHPRTEILVSWGGLALTMLRGGRYQAAYDLFSTQARAMAETGHAASWESETLEDGAVVAASYLGRLEEVERRCAPLLLVSWGGRVPHIHRLFHLGLARHVRGQRAPLEALIGVWRPRVEEEPPGISLLYLTILEGLRDVAAGRAELVVRRWPERFRIFSRTRLLRLTYERYYFLWPLIDALTAGSSGMPGQEAARRFLLQKLRFIERRGTAGFRAEVWRARALLSDDPVARREGLARALALSASSEQPWARWRALEAADSLGERTAEREQERQALAAHHGFVATDGQRSVDA